MINALAPHLPMLIGGSADLGVSNNTDIKDGGDFEADSYEGRIIHFGVREHAMGSTLTGISLNGGLIPYGGTFLTFSDYMRPAIRLAALSEVQVIYVFTHDSVGLGEDGPTHQPIEHLAALASDSASVCDSSGRSGRGERGLAHRDSAPNAPTALR